jgi:hypothetical protein
VCACVCVRVCTRVERGKVSAEESNKKCEWLNKVQNNISMCYCDWSTHGGTLYLEVNSTIEITVVIVEYPAKKRKSMCLGRNEGEFTSPHYGQSQ